MKKIFVIFLLIFITFVLVGCSDDPYAGRDWEAKEIEDQEYIDSLKEEEHEKGLQEGREEGYKDGYDSGYDDAYQGQEYDEPDYYDYSY